MGLFSDIYNKVAKFFRPQEEQGEDSAKSVASNRLKLVLMQDRTNLTPKVLEQMRGELIDLLSRYVEMDKELLELNFEQEDDQVALMLSIPVIRAKDEAEIDAAVKAAKLASEKVAKIEADDVSGSSETDASDFDENSSENAQDDAQEEIISDTEAEISSEEKNNKTDSEKSKSVSSPKDLKESDKSEGAKLESSEVQM